METVMQVNTYFFLNLGLEEDSLYPQENRLNVHVVYIPRHVCQYLHMFCYCDLTEITACL